MVVRVLQGFLRRCEFFGHCVVTSSLGIAKVVYGYILGTSATQEQLENIHNIDILGP